MIAKLNWYWKKGRGAEYPWQLMGVINDTNEITLNQVWHSSKGWQMATIYPEWELNPYFKTASACKKAICKSLGLTYPRGNKMMEVSCFISHHKASGWMYDEDDYDYLGIYIPSLRSFIGGIGNVEDRERIFPDMERV